MSPLFKPGVQLPGWALPHTLAVELRLPEATPSASVLFRLRSTEYKVLRQRIRAHLQAQALLAHPLTKAGLVVVRRGVRLLNWDSACGGLRPLVDCLVSRDSAHPDGLGQLVDDHPGGALPNMIWVLQEQVPKGQDETLVTLFDLS